MEMLYSFTLFCNAKYVAEESREESDDDDDDCNTKSLYIYMI